MRAFSTIIIAAAFVLSANAASFEKSAISAPVQLCIDDINSVTAQVTLVKTDVLAFTRADGYSAALAIQSKEQVLETRLKKAGTDCCAVNGIVSTEEADAVIAVVNNLVPEVEDVLEAIVIKMPEFDAVFMAIALIKGDIENLGTQIKTLGTCLISKNPGTHLSTTNDLVGRINTAFAAANTTYSV